MQSIFHGFNQQFQAIENAITTRQSIQNVIQAGFASAHFQITVPQTAPPPAPVGHPTPLWMTLQPFFGKPNENVQAWIGLAEDALTASQV